jgi:hypothetical protein
MQLHSILSCRSGSGPVGPASLCADAAPTGSACRRLDALRRVSWRVLAALLWLATLWARPAWAIDDQVTTAQTIAAGAYVIDMGQPAQTIANGLKPYGLVHELVINKKVPVLWAINPAKTKSCPGATCADGVDFSAGAKSYRGGSFVIRGEFVDAAVLATINTWRAKGVVVDGPIATAIANVPVYDTLTSLPRTVLDQTTGAVVAAYYTNAEIPSSAYVLGTPASLSGCNDIYVMPHADPALSTHANLIPFVTNHRGYLWSACHAVSVLENLAGMNFLSTTGLVPFTAHTTPVPPFDYAAAAGSHPLMQFLNRSDGAHLVGSEQVYLPKPGGAWRTGTTTVAINDPDHANIPALSPGEAANVAFGRAFGNPNNGLVMYEGGHKHNYAGTVAD